MQLFDLRQKACDRESRTRHYHAHAITLFSRDSLSQMFILREIDNTRSPLRSCLDSTSPLSLPRKGFLFLEIDVQ